MENNVWSPHDLIPQGADLQGVSPVGANWSCVRVLLRPHSGDPVHRNDVPSFWNSVAHPGIHRAQLVLREKGKDTPICIIINWLASSGQLRQFVAFCDIYARYIPYEVMISIPFLLYWQYFLSSCSSDQNESNKLIKLIRLLASNPSPVWSFSIPLGICEIFIFV